MPDGDDPWNDDDDREKHDQDVAEAQYERRGPPLGVVAISIVVKAHAGSALGFNRR
jgi:hypothetical protein